MPGNVSSGTGVRVQLVLLVLGTWTTWLLFAGLLLEAAAWGLAIVLVLVSLRFDVRSAAAQPRLSTRVAVCMRAHAENSMVNQASGAYGNSVHAGDSRS